MCLIFIGLRRHVCLRWVSTGNSVSNGHVGLRWGISVSNDAYQSPMRHVDLRWGMPVSDGSLIRHDGLRWVSDRSRII